MKNMLHVELDYPINRNNDSHQYNTKMRYQLHGSKTQMQITCTQF